MGSFDSDHLLESELRGSAPVYEHDHVLVRDSLGRLFESLWDGGIVQLGPDQTTGDAANAPHESGVGRSRFLTEKELKYLYWITLAKIR